MHFATHRNHAAEIIVERASHEKQYRCLTNWKKSPNGEIMASDVVIATNYLTKDEIKSLERIVTNVFRLCRRSSRKIYSRNKA